MMEMNFIINLSKWGFRNGILSYKISYGSIWLKNMRGKEEDHRYGENLNSM